MPISSDIGQAPAFGSAAVSAAPVTGVLNNGLNLANVDPYLQKIALGAVILGAVLLDQKLAKS